MKQLDSFASAGSAPSCVTFNDPQQAPQLAAALLNQQMWCWGCDIRRPAGNVLLEYGFRRWRPPPGTLGSTAYQLDLLPDQQVVLWGFGLFFGDRADGGLFLKRYTFAPLWTPACDLRAALWRPESLPEFSSPQTIGAKNSLQRLLGGALLWIAGYERWIGQTAGLAYRISCLSDWQKTVVAAESVADQWTWLARMSEELV